MPASVQLEKAARTLVYAASAPEPDGVSGRSIWRSRERKLKPIATDTGMGARLWDLSEALCGSGPATSAVSILPSRNGDRHV